MREACEVCGKEPCICEACERCGIAPFWNCKCRLTKEEIARIKEISVPAIKVQVHRAIKNLRNLYFKISP